MNDQELNKIFQWDVKNWSKAIPFWQKHCELLTGKLEGLEVAAFGEREGGLSYWFAKQGANVYCTDLKEFENTPLPIHEDYADFIQYKSIDITQIDIPANSKDIVVFKSVVGALGNLEKQEKAFSELYRILKPEGYLLFAENAKATKVHQLARKKFNNWGSYWRYPSKSELIKMCDAFSSVHLSAHGFASTFGRNDKQRNMIASFDNAIGTVLPNSWKYILFGVAQK